MLRVVTGPFHPDLEEALVADVRRLKTADPFAPLAIVVPSDALRRRLMWLLCVERHCALLDVHFLTFYQLAVRLLDEAGAFDESRLRPGFFFQELVHQLLKPDASSSAHWTDLADMPGAWIALLATLNDLKDAKVDPDQAREALAQSPMGVSAGVETLLSLYRAFVDEKARMQVLDPDDLARSAESCVAASAFLSRRQRVLYYGFYDLTQVQLDLFLAVSRSAPTTLFFPLVKDDPAYGFAQRFFERHLYGRIGPGSNGHVDLSRDRAQRQGCVQSGAPCRILSASGPFDEVTAVAKDILSLVEERGYGFQEIGVVARTLTGYETLLPAIFEQHAIPFASSLSRPLGNFPLVKTLIQLLGLRMNGYRRDQVISLLASPFLRREEAGLGNAPRLDLWDVATRRLGILKGLDEWSRLTAYTEHGLPLRDDDDDQTGPRIPGREIGALWHAVTALATSLDAVPESATWDAYVDYVHDLCDRRLDPHPEAGTGLPDSTADCPALLEDALEELRRLSAIQPDVTLADFVLALHRLMEQTAVPLASTRVNGVQVLDAMAARGMAFRALYVLGLNEKVFPRHIHEDAFLRDPVRRVLEVDVGYKIQEKLAGYDEERLLFTVLCGSAREQLILLYQRADEAGRPLVPSSYLLQLARESGIAEQSVPRRATSKFQASPLYQVDRLTTSELAVKYLLERRVPRRLLTACHPAGPTVERGVSTLRRLEGGMSRLGPCDGITGPLEASWQALAANGVSASALQEYAKCPFRYFAKQVLRLRPLSVPEGLDQLGPLELGILAHAILRRCYQSLKDRGYFIGEARSLSEAIAVLDEAARHECERFAQTHPVGYPLVWTLHQDRLRTFLGEVLREDLDEMAQGGWEPVAFEREATGRLAVPIESDEPETVAVTGRLDRVDWSATRNAYRIIDYKYKGSRKPETPDRNLTAGAVRATRLQPPLYLTMADELAGSMPHGSPDVCCDGVWFYYLAPDWEPAFLRVGFPGDAWQSELKDPMTKALTQVLSGIKAGRFFIYASGTCDTCDYRLVCRRTHQPTLWRVRTDHAAVADYRNLRSAKAPKGASGDRATPSNDDPSR